MNVFLKYVNVKTINGDEYVGIMATPDVESWKSEHLKLLDFGSKMFVFYPVVPKYEFDDYSVILREAFPLSRLKHIVIPFNKIMFGGRITEEATHHYTEFLKDSLGENYEDEIKETIITSFSALIAELEMFADIGQKETSIYVHSSSPTLN